FQFSRCIALNAWNGSEVMLLEGGSGYRLITLRPNSRSGWTTQEISISPSVIVPDTTSPVDSWIANVSFPTPGFATSCMTIRNPAKPPATKPAPSIVTVETSKKTDCTNADSKAIPIDASTTEPLPIRP